MAQPRIPCVKLGIFAQDPTMPRRFVAAVRPGAYLRITTTGHVAAGDRIEVLDRPAHGVTLADVATIYHHERRRAATLLEVPELAPMYHRWARQRTAAPNRNAELMIPYKLIPGGCLGRTPHAPRRGLASKGVSRRSPGSSGLPTAPGAD